VSKLSNSSEELAINQLIDISRSMFYRGYSFGTAGNVSVRAGETILATPTGSSLGNLDKRQIARCDLSGNVAGSAKPTKELPFHLAVYRARPQANAVVHLHSTYATAVSCLADLNVEDALPVLTPYYGMRIPNLPVVPYLPPGDPGLGREVEKRIAGTPALLLRNHGSIAVGASLAEAAALAEEIEETARLYFILGGRGQALSSEQVTELRRRFA
jgi:ribulose-5-phosphate 4-epimerase/fuculose-1-phosphate aldolase